MDMEKKKAENLGGEMLSETMSFFEKLQADKTDKLYAVLYFFLGYGFWRVFCSPDLPESLAVFTVFYMIVVLSYCIQKRIPMNREKVFWSILLLCTAVPYGFYSIMPLLQLLTIFCLAAYWTLAVTGGLLLEKKTSSWFFLDLWNGLLGLPVRNCSYEIRILCKDLIRRHFGREGGKVLLGIVTAIPVLCLILPILSSADQGFGLLMAEIYKSLREDTGEWVLKGIMAVLFGSLMYGVLYGGAYRKHICEEACMEWRETSGDMLRLIPQTTMYSFAGVICGAYALFMILQAKYLFSAFLGILPKAFTYAEYARRGFFELCAIAVFNGLLLAVMENCGKKGRKEDSNLRRLEGLLIILTMLLLLTAMSKMAMYIFAYGFTEKRILTSVFMFWLMLSSSFFLIRQKREIPAARWSVCSGGVFFALLCVIPVGNLL